jgi:signal transduction histidine kinase/DNA-binding response OmpR family regulator
VKPDIKNEPVRRAKLAICEDERIVALDIKTFLSRNGFEVTGLYPSAEELLEAVETARPELVLMDVHLEGPMDGVEAAARLYERWSIPVIFLTAYADASTIDRAKLTQPFGYVIKPFDERELRTAITIGLYRAEMEGRLRDSEARYRGLFKGGLAALGLFDAEGRLIEANRAFETLAPGCVREEQLLPDPDVRAVLRATLAEGRVFGPVELELAGLGARAIVSAAAAEGSDGSSFIFQALDVSDRASLQSQLQRAQKMEALGRIAGGAAHDFNNIITAVLGYAKLLRDDVSGRPELNEELDGIEEAARRAAILARQLLVFSRSESGEPGVFSLGEAVAGLERMLARLAGDDVRLRIHRGEGDVALADKGKIEQAVMNLAVNARDAMDGRGRITVATGAKRFDAPTDLTVGRLEPGVWAFVRVDDEGSGMEPELIRRIFDPFFSTKAPDKGTGLGLAMVADTMRQAGGGVEVQSELGKGSSFTLYLPAAAAVAAAPSGLVAELPAGKGGLILLVADDAELRSVSERLLERGGYEVLAADGPGSALIIAERERRPVVALITDLAMPLMRGDELAERLRRDRPGLPTLFMSGYADEAGPALPGSAMLPKPFDQAELLRALAALLGS